MNYIRRWDAACMLIVVIAINTIRKRCLVAIYWIIIFFL